MSYQSMGAGGGGAPPRRVNQRSEDMVGNQMDRVGGATASSNVHAG